MTVESSETAGVSRYRLVKKALNGASGIVDSVSKKTPIVGMVRDRAIEFTNTYAKPLPAFLVKGVDFCDDQVDKVVDGSQQVVKKVYGISDSIVKDERSQKVIESARDAWSRIQNSPKSLSLTDFQSRINDQVVRVNKTKEVAVSSLMKLAHGVASTAARYTELSVDLLLPPSPQDGTDEVVDTASMKGDDPRGRIIAVVHKVPYRLASKLQGMVLSSNELVKNYAHIDLLAFAQDRGLAILSFGKRKGHQFIALVQTFPLYDHIASPDKRAELRKALVHRAEAVKARLPKEMLESLEALRAKIEPKGSLVLENASYYADSASAAIKTQLRHFMNTLPPETVAQVKRTYKKVLKRARQALGDERADQLAHLLASLVVFQWIPEMSKAD